MTFDEYRERRRVFAEELGDPVSGLTLLRDEFDLMRISDVYHYTTITGFLSIMQKREMWASHIAFMNDRSEYSHGKELFRRRLSQRVSGVPETEQRFLRMVMESLEREISDGAYTTSSKDVFCLSFSYAPDSLEMWRGYGRESGIAIGFDQAQCSSLPGMSLIREEMYEKLLAAYDGKPEEVCPKYEHGFYPLTILYDDDLKTRVADRAIEMGLACFRNRSRIDASAALVTATDFLSDMMFYTIPFFKHHGFAGEEECRLVTHLVRRGADAYRVRYRERSGLLLPYLKYELMDRNCRPLKQMPIREIVIGPGVKQARVAESVRYFLERNGMADLVEKVRLSDIPYVAV